MFLSKTAICKQLFHEFLRYEALALPPGHQAELLPGTMLGSALKEDVSLGIEWAQRQLKEHLGAVGTPDENKQFDELLTALISYKSAAATADNPFMPYARREGSSVPHPCAWVVFAPLLIQGKHALSYETKELFLQTLTQPQTAIQFNIKDCPLEETGLYIAVQTNNDEMVEAFLCHEFYRYQLTKDHLKILLSLTKDPKTRLVLLRHSEKLLDWISHDAELKTNVVVSIEELRELWSSFSPAERSCFIEKTSPQLWLDLLDSPLSRKKIESILGIEFIKVKNYVRHDATLRTQESIPDVLNYLDRDEQFNYLLESIPINAPLYPLPRDKHWEKLLSALGYQQNKKGQLTTTRYLLAEPFAEAHDKLISVLIALPVPEVVIVDALKKIEKYTQDPSHQADCQLALELIGAEVVQQEYNTSFFLKRWFYKLLRYLNIMDQSPLHPYLNRLTKVVGTTVPESFTGDMMVFLPPVDDYLTYKPALDALFAKNINQFWASLSDDARIQIITDPARLAGLLTVLSQPHDFRSAWFKSLDMSSLEYFNTAQGIRQLVSVKPAFDIAQHLQVLRETVEEKHLVFLGDITVILDLMLHDSADTFKQIAPFLMGRGDVALQTQIVEAMPKPLKQEHFVKFLQGYNISAQQFSALIQEINKTNPFLVSDCWKLVPEDIWAGWYRSVNHAREWSNSLVELGLEDRLQFFDKLTSDGALTAQEFCELLEAKGDKLFFLWDLIPESQWSTWISANALPPSTKLLLKALPFPLRLNFFGHLLNMQPEERQCLLVTPEKTIEAYYAQDITEIVTKEKDFNTIKTKLFALQAVKREEFNAQLRICSESVEALDKVLVGLLGTDVKGQNSWGRWLQSFIWSRDYDVKLKSLKEQLSNIQDGYKKIIINPLLEDVRRSPATMELVLQLNGRLAQIGERLKGFNEIEKTIIPKDLESKFVEIADMFKVMEEVCVSPLLLDPSIETERVVGVGAENKERQLGLLLQHSKEIIDDLVKQFDSFYSAHETRFFKTKPVEKRTQTALEKELNYLYDCIQKMRANLAESPIHSSLEEKFTELHESLEKLKTQKGAIGNALLVTIESECKTSATNIQDYLNQLIVEVESILPKPTPRSLSV